MRNLMDLGLIGLLLTCKERPTEASNPALMKMINNLGYSKYWEFTEGELKEEAFHILDAVERHFDYYDKSDLEVNEMVDAYLHKILDDFNNAFKEDLRTVAITVCAYGNKTKSDADCSSGVEAWINTATDLLEDLKKRFETMDSVDYLPTVISRLEYCDSVLGVVDVFVTTHKGMLAGVEEFVPNDYQDIFPIEDWVAGTECAQTSDCGCGCSFTKPIALLQGMEDFLNGKVTKASMYLESVYYTNEMRLRSVQGNEEGVWDSIKEMGAKAYEWCKEVLDSFMELFNSEAIAEEVEEAEKDGEANKKALQAVSDKTMRIKPAAKAGALALAAKNDPKGDIGKALNGLNTIGDGARVITSLQALLAREVKKEGNLGTKLEKAKKAVGDLESANRKTSGSSSDNKDVAQNARTALDDKIKAAKESLKEVKAAAGAQKKFVSCIRKTIRNISPKIFMDKDNKTPISAKEPKEKATANPKEKAE